MLALMRLQLVHEIPLQYYFTLYDDTSEKSYAFDVRSLNDIINNNGGKIKIIKKLKNFSTSKLI